MFIADNGRMVTKTDKVLTSSIKLVKSMLEHTSKVSLLKGSGSSQMVPTMKATSITISPKDTGAGILLMAMLCMVNTVKQ